MFCSFADACLLFAVFSLTTQLALVRAFVSTKSPASFVHHAISPASVNRGRNGAEGNPIMQHEKMKLVPGLQRTRHNRMFRSRGEIRPINHTIQCCSRWPWRSMLLSVALLLSPATTARATTSVGSPSSYVVSFASGLWRHRRIIKRSSLFLAACYLVWARRAVRRRQSVDATSEWERYARHPGARGRALLSLVLLQLGPLWVLSRLLRSEQLMATAGRVLTQGLLQLGPLYCKMGQILSCREEALPHSWVKALEKLQDQIPAQTGEQALKLAQNAWSQGQMNSSFEDTFENFDTRPLAAASLGQVHKAVLRSTNETVAVKLQRPFLRQIYDQDLAFLTKIARGVDRFAGKMGKVGGVDQSWEEIFLDAEAILYREIDYRDEAENGIRFCQDFGLDKGGQQAVPAATSRNGEELPSAAAWLRAPYVYGNVSSEQVLVMEFVPSIKITNTAKLDAANVTAREKEYLADCLGRAYLRQFCCHKFFSTDPHPGNLGCEVLAAGAPTHKSSWTRGSAKADSSSRRVRLVFYDFGQAATLTENQADGILEIIEAIVDLDVDKSLEAFSKMGVLKSDADLGKVRAKVSENYKTGKVKANKKRLSERGYKFAPTDRLRNNTKGSTVDKKGKEAKNVRDAEVMQFFTLPAEYAFVGRALTQMAGVGKSLDSEFDFISAAAPWIYEIKGASQYLRDEVSKRLDDWGLTNIMPTYVDSSRSSSSGQRRPTKP